MTVICGAMTASDIFDRQLLRVRQQRARALGAETFLIDRVAGDLAERLSVVLRRFERAVDLGTPTDAVRRLLAESGKVATIIAATPESGPRVGSLRVAADEAERALLWKGRKSAFGAIARIAPDYYLHDAVVPRTRLVEVLQQVYAIAAEHRLTMMNVFHAGDGNLHPLILFNANDEGELRKAETAGAEILKLCVEVGGCLTGEHGVGIEKRDLMPFQFSPAELALQMQIKNVFDPAWLLNPAKVFPLEGRPVAA